MFTWRKLFLGAAPLGATIALAAALAIYFTPRVETEDVSVAYSDGAKHKIDEGLFLLDLLVVRPVSLLVVVADVISYPAVALLGPFFVNDQTRLRRGWLTNSVDYLFDRPLGNFNWKPREYKKEEQR